ncbi:MAG: hypothetical protein ABI867_08135 [Kofleriaceae bacterium]
MKTWTAVVVVLAAFATRADARPTYARELSPVTLDRARAELAEAASKEGLEADVVSKFLDLKVFAISNDTGCPGIDVEILNATSHTVWAVEVKVSQTKGSQSKTDTIHLPYLTANTETRVTVDCLNNYVTRSRYDYDRGPGISIDYSAHGVDLLAEALPVMMRQRADYAIATRGVTPREASPGLDTRTLLETALAFDDDDVAKELVATIVRTNVGAKELGAHIAGGGEGPILDEVASSMSRLTGAQQAEVARVLVATEAAERWKAKLLPMIDRQLCGGARPLALGLWIQAAQPDGIPVKELHDRILERCAPRPGDGPAIVAAVNKTPERAGGVFDALDAKLFAGVVAAWKANKGDPSQAQLAFLRDSANEQRFDQAAAAIPPAHLQASVQSVALAPDLAISTHKATWVTGALATVKTSNADADSRVELVTSLYRSLVDGKVSSEAMRLAVRDSRVLSPPSADSVLASAAAEQSRVYDPQKLVEAGVDLQEFIVFARANLGSCAVSIEQLRACATAIVGYKAPAGTTSLTKAGANVRDEFLVEVRKLVDDSRDFATFVPLAKALGEAGIAPGFVTDRMCREAEAQVRADDSDANETLGYIAEIDPEASCLSAARSTQSSKRSTAVIMTIVALLGLILPVPASGWWMRRRWRKLHKDLPLPEVDTSATVAKLDQRLGTAGLGRTLPNGIAEAKRELAGSPAGQGLESVSPEIVDRAVATIHRAVATGDAASLLIETAGDTVYIVALPVRHARPQVIQRYLGGTWPEHLAAVQRAAGKPVLALVLLCGPDIAEAALLVGHHDGSRSSDPEVLLDAREARDRGANRFHHVVPLA